MGKKFALCVGINDYPGDANDLGGCVNDAYDWAEVLNGQGYAVTTLTDHAATCDAIVATLREFSDESRFGDKIVFTFSGHGSWVPDTNGDEIDGRDEVLCTYDYFDGHFLSDDDLADMVAASKRGVGCLILSDSCHSGTLTRAIGTEVVVGAVAPAETPKFIPPHTFIPDLSRDAAIAAEETVAGTPRKVASLVAACADNEYAYDAVFMGRPNGAFTRAAIDAYRGEMTLNVWYKAIVEKLPTPEYPQHPQLTATTYRKYSRAL